MELEKIYLESLGCAKNLVDSEVMVGSLTGSGYRFTQTKQEADIIIINTCAFIEDATRESIETILLLAGEKQTGSCSYLIVCGCFPQRYKAELINELPEVDLFLGTGEIQNITRHIKTLTTEKRSKKIFVNRPSFLMDASTPRLPSTPGSSAYIKIAEGCSHRCTFCTIPSIRGPYQGRHIESIVKEALHLSENGFQEINLISQDTTRFDGLSDLLKKLAKISGIQWIRLLYCHPHNLNGNVIDVIAEEKKICQYIDIPLQHITDHILKRMGRRVSRKKIELILETMRKRMPEIAVRTTFIVGFPGETDKDFEALSNFVKTFQFEHVGVFPYRDEEGTPAFSFDNKISEDIKNERYGRLMSLQAGIAKEKNKNRIGQQLDVLVENISSHENYRLQARTEFQAPEVDGVVFINDDVPIGSFQKVLISNALTYDLIGDVNNN